MNQQPNDQRKIYWWEEEVPEEEVPDEEVPEEDLVEEEVPDEDLIEEEVPDEDPDQELGRAQEVP